MEQVVDSYEFFWNVGPNIAWYKFKGDFIYNENRLERLDLDDDVVAEIITDLRMKRSDSEYCKDSFEEIIQVLGHAAMYDYIFDTEDKLTIYKIQELNRQLYQYAPYPEAAGAYRRENNMVTGAEFETLDYTQVISEIVNLDSNVRHIEENAREMNYSEYIKEVVKVHHRLTVIHPFWDGNGRCSRAMLNWMFRLKGIPPIYIKFSEKEEYYEGLKEVDSTGDFRRLTKVFLKEVIRSSMQLNKVDISEVSEE
ncbi:MAG: Fic family protein [Niameybacter sp.]|uniref:Fic family protein n=1 Tax=Niameybacter sp. TaxID=2033640 RepID=UPI002FCA7181